MKKFLLFLVTIASISTVWAEPIKIGAILPLSGAVAPWGERVRIGVETANALQGNRFAVTFEDEGACEPQKALTAYRKLVNVDKVQVIFLGCLSGTAAIAPVALNDKVLLLSLGLLNDSTLHSGSKLIDLATEIGTEATALTQYVLQEKPKRPAGIFFADAFGQEFSTVLSEELKIAETPFVARDDADPQFESFKSLILKWKKLDVDLLVTTLSDKQQSTLLREMQQLGFKPKIYSSYVLECFAPPVADRKYFEGIKYTHPVNVAEGTEERERLNVELAKVERDWPGTNINAFFAYDGLVRLSAGISRCNGVDSACLYDYFRGLGMQRGVSGDMYFKSSGALERPYGLKIVRNAEFEWIEKRGLSDGSAEKLK